MYFSSKFTKGVSYRNNVTYLIKETSIKLIPFSCFQITLFNNSRFPENIYFCTNKKVPTLNNKYKRELTVTIEFLCLSPVYISFTKYFVSLIVISWGFPSKRYIIVIMFFSRPSIHQLSNRSDVISPIKIDNNIITFFEERIIKCRDQVSFKVLSFALFYHYFIIILF